MLTHSDNIQCYIFALGYDIIFKSEVAYGLKNIYFKETQQYLF